MNNDNWLMQLSGQDQTAQLAETNSYTSQFGLTLSDEDARLLVREGRDCLREQQRVEFGEGILPRLARLFCDSAFIWQENYADTLGRLQEIFYLYKNESLDLLTDDELLRFMRDAFENECQGSLDYLEETALESFAREMRSRL